MVVALAVPAKAELPMVERSESSLASSPAAASALTPAPAPEPALSPTPIPAPVGSAGSVEPAESKETTANNPLSLVPAVQVQNYFQPVLNGQGGSNQPYIRAILPFDGFGGRNLMRISLPTATMVWNDEGMQAGLGDLTVFSVRVFKISHNAGIGVGPLLVVPTTTNRAVGLKDWQLGAQGTFSAHYPWGLLAGLLGYQQSLGGKANTFTAQPFIFRNIGDGFYLRSSAIATLDTSNGTGVLPIGLGLGRVTRLPSGHLLNVYLEPQYSVVAKGDAQPRFQVFAGFNLQFVPK